MYRIIWLMVLLPVQVSTAKYENPVLTALHQAAQDAKVPYKLISALCTVESNLNPKAINKSDGGSPSYGLCQIKLNTARLMGFTGKIKHLYNPTINALYSAKYLKYQYCRYGEDWIKAVHAYNKGSVKQGTVYSRYVNKVLKKVLK